MKLFYVTYVDLYLSEVGDGDPDLQYTQQEEYVMHQRCLGRWKAKDEDDLKDKIFDFTHTIIGIETLFTHTISIR